MALNVSPATKARWFALVEELLRSGEPVADFADRHDVNRKTLKCWVSHWRTAQRGQLALVSAPAGFVAVELPPEPPPEPPPAPLHLRIERSGAVLAIPPTADLDFLRRVVDALC